MLLCYNNGTDRGDGPNDMEFNERGITMRRYGLLDLLFEGAVAAADYIADERREKRGERQRNNVYLGDISGKRSIDFAEQLRIDMENEKAMRQSTEQQQRNNYNFSNRNAGMDDLFAASATQNNAAPQSGQSFDSSPYGQEYDGAPELGGSPQTEPKGSGGGIGGNNSHGFWGD